MVTIQTFFRIALVVATFLICCSCQVAPNHPLANLLSQAQTSSKFYEYTSCVDYTTITSTYPQPDTGASLESAVSSNLMTDMTSQDGVLAWIECLPSSATGAQILEYVLDVSNFTLPDSGSATLTWVGRAGGYTGSCNGTYLPELGDFRIDFFNGSTSTWSSVYSGAYTTSTETISQSFSSLSTYAPSNQFWVRVVAEPGTANDCASVQTDFISISLSN